MLSEPASGIIVTLQVQDEAQALQEKLQQFRVVTFLEEDFKVEHAKSVISEAYISEQTLKYIIIAAKSFNHISQNSLLKLFEEPPRNIRFIVIVESKSILLDTIKSRLPILKHLTNHQHIEINLDFSKIDNEMIFAFIKEHERVTRQEAKGLLQAIYRQATVTNQLILSRKQLESFEKGYKLLELNAQTASVFALVLMSFVVKEIA